MLTFLCGILFAVWLGGIAFFVKEEFPVKRKYWTWTSTAVMFCLPFWPVVWPLARLFWKVKRTLDRRAYDRRKAAREAACPHCTCRTRHDEQCCYCKHEWREGYTPRCRRML